MCCLCVWYAHIFFPRYCVRQLPNIDWIGDGIWLSIQATAKQAQAVAIEKASSHTVVRSFIRSFVRTFVGVHVYISIAPLFLFVIITYRRQRRQQQQHGSNISRSLRYLCYCAEGAFCKWACLFISILYYIHAWLYLSLSPSVCARVCESSEVQYQFSWGVWKSTKRALIRLMNQAYSKWFGYLLAYTQYGSLFYIVNFFCSGTLLTGMDVRCILNHCVCVQLFVLCKNIAPAYRLCVCMYVCMCCHFSLLLVDGKCSTCAYIGEVLQSLTAIELKFGVLWRRAFHLYPILLACVFDLLSLTNQPTNQPTERPDTR